MCYVMCYASDIIKDGVLPCTLCAPAQLVYSDCYRLPWIVHLQWMFGVASDCSLVMALHVPPPAVVCMRCG